MGKSKGAGTCEGDGLVDEEEGSGGDAGGGLDLGNDGADAVAEGVGPVELRTEGHELGVHDGRRQGIGGSGGVGRSGGAEASQGEEGDTAGREEAGGRGWKRRGPGEDGGGAEAERGGRDGGCYGCGSHRGVGFRRFFDGAGAAGRRRRVGPLGGRVAWHTICSGPSRAVLEVQKDTIQSRLFWDGVFTWEILRLTRTEIPYLKMGLKLNCSLPELSSTEGSSGPLILRHASCAT
jgi:hypothetical protein